MIKISKYFHTENDWEYVDKILLVIHTWYWHVWFDNRYYELLNNWMRRLSKRIVKIRSGEGRSRYSMRAKLEWILVFWSQLTKHSLLFLMKLTKTSGSFHTYEYWSGMNKSMSIQIKGKRYWFTGVRKRKKIMYLWDTAQQKWRRCTTWLQNVLGNQEVSQNKRGIFYAWKLVCQGTKCL